MKHCFKFAFKQNIEVVNEKQKYKLCTFFCLSPLPPHYTHSHTQKNLCVRCATKTSEVNVENFDTLIKSLKLPSMQMH